MGSNLMSRRNQHRTIEIAIETVRRQLNRPENAELLAKLPKAKRREKIHRPEGPPSEWPSLRIEDLRPGSALYDGNGSRCAAGPGLSPKLAVDERVDPFLAVTVSVPGPQSTVVGTAVRAEADRVVAAVGANAYRLPGPGPIRSDTFAPMIRSLPKNAPQAAQCP